MAIRGHNSFAPEDVAGLTAGALEDFRPGQLGRIPADAFQEFKPAQLEACLLYTSPSPRDVEESRMPSSA